MISNVDRKKEALFEILRTATLTADKNAHVVKMMTMLQIEMPNEAANMPNIDDTDPQNLIKMAHEMLTKLFADIDNQKRSLKKLYNNLF